ncbi:antifreeze protein [Jannaschia sp. W003]|uniref:antifreeze protein n=1 Tax=Jannaschia sp. W003 TaxID=2867012 RepID=UPI0021A6EFC2|nr:antifreeze protein [Jannaschia sp. W003]UWQ20946.1 antifreeze protein [Jannaschia sp. W003]
MRSECDPARFRDGRRGSPAPMMMQMMRLNLATATMLAEAQTVIGMRLMGLAGLVPASAGESVRMVTEKQAAFAEAGIAATKAMVGGANPLGAMEAALVPISRTTNANSRRLTRARR